MPSNKNLDFYQLSRILNPSAPLMAKDISLKNVVFPGKPVPIILQKSGLIIKTIGISQSSGKLGDQVQVKLKNNKILTGKIKTGSGFMSKFKHLFLIFFMSGCANYISNMHQEFDKYDKRGKSSRDLQSTGALERLAEDKRYNSGDFKDSSQNTSLWVGNGKENFFSSGGVRKEKGDLVTIHVYGKLKNQITNELTRLYPVSKESPSGSGETNTNSKTKEKPSTVSDSDTKTVHDKISVVISKEVRDNHVILTGRKQLMFQNNRHLIEVQALVHRKDIANDDSLNSNKIIQSNIRVLR